MNPKGQAPGQYLFFYIQNSPHFLFVQIPFTRIVFGENRHIKLMKKIIKFLLLCISLALWAFIIGSNIYFEFISKIFK